LGDIEECITGTMLLPRREAQVCSRILYGLSSAGIALHLDVSEQTVKTYRKRAYERLGIGSERELLTWYLRRWSNEPVQHVSGPAACRSPSSLGSTHCG
jgi:DNA-binding NarL/FixJ family response regulator